MPSLNEIAAQIETITDTWRTQLLELNSVAVHFKPTEDRWSISEVVGHLIDSACNNHQRFIRAQSVTELEFPRYDQNAWVAAADYRNGNWQSLVELWYHYNRQLAVLIRNMNESKLTVSCTITPYEPCTLGFLVNDYVEHLQHHLDKLSERIATECLT